MPRKKEKFGLVVVLNAAMAVTPELYVMEYQLCTNNNDHNNYHHHLLHHHHHHNMQFSKNKFYMQTSTLTDLQQPTIHFK